MATVNAFPDEATLEAEFKTCFSTSRKHLIDAGILDSHDQTNGLSGDGRKLVRPTVQISFSVTLNAHLNVTQLKERLSQLRGEIKTKAKTAVPASYGISKLNEAEISALAKMLTKKSAFTFRDPANVS